MSKKWLTLASYFLYLFLLFNRKFVSGIVNLHQESSNPIFYKRIPPSRSLRAVSVGIQCLDEVAGFYFYKRESLTRSYNLIVAIHTNMTTPAAEIQNGYLKLMNEVIENSNKHNLFQIRIITDGESYKNQTQNDLILADFYVFVTDSLSKVINLIDQYASRMNSWNPGARFLVLYNNIDQYQNESEIIMDIYSQMLDLFYIHRITIVYATQAYKYSISSLDYFSKNACRTVKSRNFGICENGKLEPEKKVLKAEMDIIQNHTDSANCTFYVCASIAAPFVENDCINGIELQIIYFIKRHLGLNVEITCNTTNRGVLEGDDDWNGLLGRLKRGRCDFIIGGFYPDNDVTSAFWTSDTYLDDRHTWFIKLAKERPAWMALYSIFEWQTWLCVLAMLPVTWISWYFFEQMLPEPKNHKEFSLVGINNMALTICVAINERPLCHATRVFVLAFSIYGIITVSTYNSRLIAVFANPGYLHQIDNINKVIEAGIPFGGPAESRDWFESEDDKWIEERYNESELFEPNSENLEAVKNGKRVILGSRMFIAQTNISDKVFAFPENVFSSPVQMIMKPGFPFMYEINWLIRNMRDIGVFSRFLKTFDFNNTYLNRIRKMRPDFPEPNIVITTEHLQGSFLILILGLFLSYLLFLKEACVGKRNETKKKKAQRIKQSKKQKKLIKYKQKKQESVKKIKSRYSSYLKEKENNKCAPIQAKFGNTTQHNSALQNRFTPIHVFKNYVSEEYF